VPCLWAPHVHAVVVQEAPRQPAAQRQRQAHGRSARGPRDAYQVRRQIACTTSQWSAKVMVAQLCSRCSSSGSPGLSRGKRKLVLLQLLQVCAGVPNR